MNHVTMAAFADELEKIAGVGSFLMKGVRGWKAALSKSPKSISAGTKGPLPPGMARRKGLKEHGSSIKKLYQRGSEKATAAGKSGVWGGVKRVAKSPYGAMGTVAGGSALAVGGGASALSGGGSERQYR